MPEKSRGLWLERASRPLRLAWRASRGDLIACVGLELLGTALALAVVVTAPWAYREIPVVTAGGGVWSARWLLTTPAVAALSFAVLLRLRSKRLKLSHEINLLVRAELSERHLGVELPVYRSPGFEQQAKLAIQARTAGYHVANGLIGLPLAAITLTVTIVALAWLSWPLALAVAIAAALAAGIALVQARDVRRLYTTLAEPQRALSAIDAIGERDDLAVSVRSDGRARAFLHALAAAKRKRVRGLLSDYDRRQHGIALCAGGVLALAVLGATLLPSARSRTEARRTAWPRLADRRRPTAGLITTEYRTGRVGAPASQAGRQGCPLTRTKRARGRLARWPA